MLGNLGATLGEFEIDLDLDIAITIGVFPSGATLGTTFADLFAGTPADDVFDGLDGDDTLFGGMGDDALNGSGGNDSLYGEGNADQLFGGDGNDTLDGGVGGDFLFGGAGDDSIIGGFGPDLVYGGDDADTVSLGGGADFGYGDDGNDTLFGGGSTDVLTGGTGADVLRGETGDDVLYGEAGADILDGGDDFDIASYATSTQAIRLAPDAIGEVGRISATSGSWTTVTFSETLANPSVVIGSITDDDGDPVTARTRNVTDLGFEVRLEEWAYQDGSHGPETLHWIAVETGVHTLDNGMTIAAGSASALEANVFQTVSFGTTFGGAPVVLSQVSTQNDTDAVVTRQRRVDGDSVQLSLEPEEGDGIRGDETVGWIAIESGGSAGSGFLTGETPNAVTHNIYEQVFGGSISGPRVFLADMQTRDGVETGTVRLDSLNPTRARFFIEEDESVDVDGHADEVVGYSAHQAGTISGRALGSAGSFATIGETGTVTVAQASAAQWHSVSFSQSLTDATVVMGPVSNNDGEEAFTKVRNVTSTGFEFQIDEWDYQDGIHASETIGWMAVEAGEHELADGRRLSAGNATVENQASVTFATSFATAPVVLTELGSDDENVAAVTRLSARSETGFTVEVQEEQAGLGALARAHADEDADWIAIETGGSAAAFVAAGQTADNVRDNPFLIDFDDFVVDPVFLAQMQTTDGGDTANARLTDLQAGSATVFLDEEQSRDTETNHTTEIVGFAAIAEGLLYGSSLDATNDADGDSFIDIERIYGTELADTMGFAGGATELEGGGGDDTLLASSGADRFVFDAGDGDDVLLRFTDGPDLIDFSEHGGISGFGDLTISAAGSDVVIAYGVSDSITLTAMRLDLIDAGDFVFA